MLELNPAAHASTHMQTLELYHIHGMQHNHQGKLY